MRNTLLYFLAALVIFPVTAQQQPEWQSQYAVGLNKLAPHTYVWPYQTVSDIRNGDYESSPYYMSLNGSWKFHWVKNPDNRPKDFYKPEFYTGGWADIQVPGNWERQGYGTAIYVNETYEFDDKLFHFKKNPPLVPYKENEVGSYRRTFTIPADWEDRRVVICCEGVISFYYIWVNGHLLGYNQGSKTPTEWDITDKLKKGENTVALEVYRWSAGSYLECQDMWRLSGIERDVFLKKLKNYFILKRSLSSDCCTDHVITNNLTFYSRRKNMKKIFAVSALALALGMSGAASAQMVSGGFQGPGLAPMSVADALKLNDDTAVVLVGQIERSLGDEKYLFKDASGTVTVEIDNEDWRGLNVTPQDTVILNGEIDKEMFKDTKIDVDSIALKK